MVQLLVLFWVGSSLLQDIRLARQGLFTFGAAAAVFAVATVVGLPGFTMPESATGGLKRQTALDYNPNWLATVMAVAAVILIGLLLDNTRRTRGKTFLLVGLAPPVLLLLVGTGSRGGIASFVLGASLFLVPMAPSRRRFAGFALASLGLIALGLMVSRNPLTMARWTATVKEGQIAKRDRIWAAGTRMFLERPILGWGPIANFYELKLRSPNPDPQNLLLGLLLEVGVAGTVFFAAGYWLCVRAAWKSRAGPEGILPLAVITTLTVKNFSGTGLTLKEMWLFLALALASPVVSTNWKRAISARDDRARASSGSVMPAGFGGEDPRGSIRGAS
jgi:O-antigen ligase